MPTDPITYGDHVIMQVRAAKYPEDLFPPMATTADELNNVFRYLAKILHPDKRPGHPDANADFQHLTTLAAEAKDLADKGLWPRLSPASMGPRKLQFQTPTGLWVVNEAVGDDDLSWYYRGREGKKEVLVEVVKSHRDNDLAQRAFDTATALRTTAGDPGRRKIYSKYIMPPVDSGKVVLHEDGSHRHVSVWKDRPQFRPLADIHQIHGGLEMCHVAWIMNRVLEILGWAHLNGIVHGAPLIQHIVVDTEAHGAKLRQWGFSGKDGTRFPAYPTETKDFSAETLKTAILRPKHDVRLVAAWGQKLMLDKLGKPVDRLNSELQVWFKDAHDGRWATAWDAYGVFRDLLARRYGPPRFMKFPDPPTKSA